MSWHVVVIPIICLIGCIGSYLAGFAAATFRWTGRYPYEHRRSGTKLHLLSNRHDSFQESRQEESA